MQKKVLLKNIGEFGLVDILAHQTGAPHTAVLQGIGDDAAVVDAGKNRRLLITTDTLVEGIHFNRSYTTAYRLGKKALAVNVSDIAAMGGAVDLCYVVSLAAAPSTPTAYVQKIYRGMSSMAERFGASLVGGDTVSCPDGLVISITLFGHTDDRHIIYRSGARPGDEIWVTGTLGDAALGLKLLKRSLPARSRGRLVGRHLDPLPRLGEASDLACSSIASSMIDISDGLLGDLRHILTAGGVGARIMLDRIPLSAPYRKQCRGLPPPDFYTAALCGGEDYELLFTAASGTAKKIKRISARHGVSCTRVGTVTGEPSVLDIIDREGNRVNVTHLGYRHF